jgi:hypothetical protein
MVPTMNKPRPHLFDKSQKRVLTLLPLHRLLVLVKLLQELLLISGWKRFQQLGDFVDLQNKCLNGEKRMAKTITQEMANAAT